MVHVSSATHLSVLFHILPGGREAPAVSVCDGKHATVSLVCRKLCIAGNLISSTNCDLVGHWVWRRVRYCY